MKLVLFGGVQGVGKTALLSWLENKFARRITILDPGELFRRYVYNEKIKTAEEIEEHIVKKLLETPNDATVVCHWHYAVSRPEGYIPQISFARLRRIAESGNIKRVVLCVIEAPINTVRKRRLQDRQAKKRSISQSTIRKEVKANEEFLKKHKDLFSRILRSRDVAVVRFINTDLEAAKRALYNFFKTLLD